MLKTMKVGAPHTPCSSKSQSLEISYSPTCFPQHRETRSACNTGPHYSAPNCFQLPLGIHGTRKGLQCLILWLEEYGQHSLINVCELL